VVGVDAARGDSPGADAAGLLAAAEELMAELEEANRKDAPLDAAAVLAPEPAMKPKDPPPAPTPPLEEAAAGADPAAAALPAGAPPKLNPAPLEALEKDKAAGLELEAPALAEDMNENPAWDCA